MSISECIQSIMITDFIHSEIDLFNVCVLFGNKLCVFYGRNHNWVPRSVHFGIWWQPVYYLRPCRPIVSGQHDVWTGSRFRCHQKWHTAKAQLKAMVKTKEISVNLLLWMRQCRWHWSIQGGKLILIADVPSVAFFIMKMQFDLWRKLC